MSERLSVRYRGQNVCCFDLTDKNGQYIEELRQELRLASQGGELLCPDCGERMTLCAGAIRQPYFRHFDLRACEVAINLKTAPRIRTYRSRAILYRLLQKSGFSNTELVEQAGSAITPILFDTETGRAGYVYLDGKTRNYKAFLTSIQEYQKAGIPLYIFLNRQFRSHSANITSDEAECLRINGGEIYYIDTEARGVTIRRKYLDCNNMVRYFEEAFEVDTLCPDADGSIHCVFLQHFKEHLKKEAKSLAKILRLNAGDGLDEEYFETDYLVMDSIGEIWVLPEFAYATAECGEHKENRRRYLEEQNKYMFSMNEAERSQYADALENYVMKHQNSWNWE